MKIRLNIVGIARRDISREEFEVAYFEPSNISISYEADFVYGNYIDEVLMMRDVSSAEDYYYGHDHLFSPAVLFASGGTVEERYEYDAYGKAAILNPQYASRNTSLYDNSYLFTGRRLDIIDGGSLKIYYYRNRYYDADTGRFVTRDPLGITPMQTFLDSMPLVREKMLNNTLQTEEPVCQIK